MTLELNELKWSQFENKLKWNRLFPEIFTTIWETENKAHAETIFVFIFIYVSSVFPWTNLLHEICRNCFTQSGFRKICTFFFFFFFFDIEDFQYTFILPHTTVCQVIFNISWIIFNNIYETFTLYQREQSILILLYM